MINDNYIPINNSVTYNAYTIAPLIPIIILNGNSALTVPLEGSYTDLGVSVIYILESTPIIPYITSIKNSSGIELLFEPINASSSNLLSVIDSTVLTTYTITYTATASNGNVGIITRSVQIIKTFYMIKVFTERIIITYLCCIFFSTNIIFRR